MIEVEDETRALLRETETSKMKKLSCALPKYTTRALMIMTTPCLESVGTSSRSQGYTVTCSLQGYTVTCSLQGYTVTCSLQRYTVTCSLQGYTVTCSLQGYTVTCSLQGYTVTCSLQGYTVTCSLQGYTVTCSLQGYTVTCSLQGYTVTYAHYCHRTFPLTHNAITICHYTVFPTLFKLPCMHSPWLAQQVKPVSSTSDSLRYLSVTIVVLA